MNRNPTGRARLHLLKALTNLVETWQMHIPPATDPELAVSLEKLDDLLNGVLSRVTRSGLTERKECFDDLDTALARLDQAINQWAVDQKSILWQILDLARSYIKTVRGDLRFVPDHPEEERYFSNGGKKPERPLDHILTKEEDQVIKLSAQGFTQAEISSRLKLSTAAVRTHHKDVLKKLKCRNMTQAVAVYVAAESEEYG